jgi:tol-pal system protein YbgF
MKKIGFLIIFLFVSNVAFSDAKTDALLKEIQQLRADLKVLEKAVYSQSFGDKKNAKETPSSFEGALTRQLVKITELEEQLQKITASNEETLFKLQQVSDRLNKMQSDAELRFTQLESGDPKKITRSNQPPKKFPGTDKPQDLGKMVMKQDQQSTNSISPAGVVKTETVKAQNVLPEGTPEKQYQFATSLIKIGDYEKAEVALKEFVQKNPQHNLAGNAQYWFAETFYIRQLYPDAAAAYLDGYQKYPKSSKAPENLLKLGITLSELGEKDQGCLMLNGIEQQYPNAPKSVIQKAKYEKSKYKCSKIG